MAKHSIIIALFAVILATVTASIYETTTTTTVEITEEKAAAEDQCRQQIQGQQQLLNVCQRYLTDSSRSLQAPPVNIENSWREEYPRCCEQLEKVQEQCRCEAVRMVVEQQRQQGGEELQGQERQEMLKTAMSLPALCRIGPQQRCDIQSTAAWF